jgi:SNF family Na+-dependent transporter
MMGLLQSIESSGFSQWVKQSGSLWAFPGILLLHTYGMAILVGVIAGIDLRILGLMPAVPLAPLRKLLPLVWAAFWVNAITGTMLLAADATSKMRNPDFGVKMAFILLAVIAQRAIQTRVFGDPDLDRQPFSSNAKMLAAASLACWLGAITAGRLLAYVGNPGGL